MKKLEIDLLKLAGGVLLWINAFAHPSLLNVALPLMFTVSFKLVLVKK